LGGGVEGEEGAVTKRRDHGEESLAEIGRSYNVNGWTISSLSVRGDVVKLLYIGTHVCPADSLARLLVLGDEIVFLDQPSVIFDNWGTVGAPSFMRRFSFEGSPVTVSVVEPPSPHYAAL
jgi:hypothetical protein